MASTEDKMQKITSLAKRRGFINQSSEIYGGAASAYDYGPLGVELKNNVKQLWWQNMVKLREDVVGLDAAILMHPRVWEASGHVENFTDPLVECKKCHHRFKNEDIKEKCPDCEGTLTEPKVFNLMFKTHIGPIEDKGSAAYLRPETAQGIYVNFPFVLDSMRLKIPLGIAQVGKAFRNEITPGNFTFRTIEFEQMEMQYFVRPKEASRYFKEWKKNRMAWYQSLGINKAKLRWHDHSPKELAHYAKEATDIEYEMPFGWQEVEGVHNRGDYDLTQHEKFSGKDLKYFDEAAGEKFIPHIIETSAGADRLALTLLLDAYHEEEVKGEKRVVLKFANKVAPMKLAVLPLVRNKSAIVKKAREVFDLIKGKYLTWYDEAGSIGRRYRRQDEVGTPYCITIDHETLEDGEVTVRDRDSMKQDRIKIADLTSWLAEHLQS